jgi:hypothetical protein
MFGKDKNTKKRGGKVREVWRQYEIHSPISIFLSSHICKSFPLSVISTNVTIF